MGYRVPLVLFLSLAFSSTVLALPVARMRGVVPTVDVGKNGRAFRGAQNRGALNFGDIVRTGTRGRVELLFNNGSQIALRERTSVEILAPKTPDKPLVVRVFGALGEVFVRAKGQTEIRTAAGTAAVRGTAFSVRLDSQTQTTLTVSEGEVGFSNPFGAVSVAQNQQSTATTSSAPTPPVAVDPSGLLGWTLDVAALPQSDFTPQEKAALVALQGGNLQVAAELGSSESPNMLALLSLEALFEGNAKAALKTAKFAVKNEPFSPLALLALGRAELARGEVDEAGQAIAQAAALAPNNALLQNEYGAILTRLDRLPRAQKAFETALQIEPNNAVALAGLANVQNRRGQTQLARENFEKATAAARDNAFVRAQYANFLVETGDLKAATQIGEELLARKTQFNSPDLGGLYIRLSEAALFDQKLNSALQYAQKAVAILPNSAPARYQLGRVFLEQNRNAQAQNQFRLAVALDPNFNRARFAFGLTQELIAGGDGTNVLGQIAGGQESSQNAQLNIQNLGTPGQNEQIQAVTADPLVLRAASRSFGDTQITGVIGEDSIRRGEISTLQENRNRRQVFGALAAHNERDGVRDGVSFESQQVGVSLGAKNSGDSDGFFATARYRKNKDVGADDFFFASNSRATTEIPELIGSYVWRNGERVQTRILARALRPELRQRNANNGFRDIDGEGTQLELRHDHRLGAHFLSFGLALGEREFKDADLASTPFGSLSSRGKDSFKSQIVYLRDDWRLGQKWNLIGELKGRRTRQRLQVTSTITPPPPFTPPPVDNTKENFTGSPTVILNYRPDVRTSIRWRSTRETAGIRDFDLLAPTDIFLFTPVQLPDNVIFNRQTRHDFEIERTVGTQTFVRLGAIEQKGDFLQSQVGDTISDARFRGLRFGFDTLLNPQTTLFANADFYSTRSGNQINGTPISRSAIVGVPKQLLQIGGQYLGDDGFFVQPSLAYIGRRVNQPLPDLNGNLFQTTQGGFALANLRVGKRWGLRQTVFAEVTNIFDKEYVTFYSGTVLQPGRQLRFGAILRF